MVGSLPCAGFGGVIRGEKGAWVGRYSGHLNTNSVLYTEPQSIKHGLLHVWEKGYRRVWCESDSLHALQLTNTTQCLRFHVHADVIEDIKALVVCDWQTQFSHIWREGNRCADAMAKFGSEETPSLRNWDNRSSWIEDSVGTVYIRV